ncbi:MAG: hypothetical protein ACR2IP_11080 [Solirubrobacteraceae bacterium]
MRAAGRGARRPPAWGDGNDGKRGHANAQTKRRVARGPRDRRAARVELLAVGGGVVVEVRIGEHPIVSVASIGDHAAGGTRFSASGR